jgi:hypothetical protein
MVLLTTKFLDVAKFTTLTPLSLLISCETAAIDVSYQFTKEFRSYLQIKWHKNNYQIKKCCKELTGGLKNFITDTLPYKPTSLIGRRPSGVTRYISKRVFLAKMRFRSLEDVKFPAIIKNVWLKVSKLSCGGMKKKADIPLQIIRPLAAHNRRTLWYHLFQLQFECYFISLNIFNIYF